MRREPAGGPMHERIDLETAAPDPERLALWEIFKQRLHELGHAKAPISAFEFRWAEGAPNGLRPRRRSLSASRSTCW